MLKQMLQSKPKAKLKLMSKLKPMAKLKLAQEHGVVLLRAVSQADQSTQLNNQQRVRFILMHLIFVTMVVHGIIVFNDAIVCQVSQVGKLFS